MLYTSCVAKAVERLIAFPKNVCKKKFAPICGRCASPLAVGTEPLVVGEGNFAEIIERSPLPALVDFWAAWCGPCRRLAPTIEQLAGELDGRARVAKLNIDENPKSASRFNVRSIPTIIIFKDGREVDRLIGLMTKAQILQRLSAWLGT